MENLEIKYAAIWCISARLHPLKANVSLYGSCAQNFKNKNLNGENCGSGLQMKNIPRLNELNKLSKGVFELDEKKTGPQITSFLFNIHLKIRERV